MISLSKRVLFRLLLLFCGAAVEARACPLISRLVDFNCDQSIRILVTGDSLVDGIGDEKRRGGYVARLDDLLEIPQVMRLGIPGITTKQLLRYYKRHFYKVADEDATVRLKDLDLLIIDVGRNDFWDKQPESFTTRNITRIVKLLRKELSADGATPPFIAVATLTPTTRGFQRAFIDEVNRLLLEESSPSLPVYIHFETLNPDFISIDGIHPMAKGYNRMSKIAFSYIRNQAKLQMAALRQDQDQDGVYDLFESSRFGTDPLSLDSDLDSLSDGEELFTHATDPLSLDTDLDGLADGAELAAGRNPLDPTG